MAPAPGKRSARTALGQDPTGGRTRGSARNEDDEVASARTIGEVFDLTGEEPSKAQYEKRIRQDTETPLFGPFSINLPVASEIVDTDYITYRQSFEMWRLRTYLELIDASWGILATLVQHMP
ncbi:Hypothetical Protein FCC1311_063172 [Hondaea fermentalgiana]|uniref:Uncharacterized protein n=1 Tax=Hondaea fermentalgiana TaxID=2315210 RepID=A0A2R5GGT8_9STRA|nr:Hypothetical Protein FCC1311_063172 [Hondaea fermentalgiana]|eukprot:GBG30097.1 Hypothetical Protein FCC1311_063172 [Hondaea fermentalgiana]